MLWARETEGHQFDTPERRAALEAQSNRITASIADEAVRKYYRQDFAARIAQLFAPPAGERYAATARAARAGELAQPPRRAAALWRSAASRPRLA